MTRVLIVEDDPALRNSIRSTLERNGYEVRTAGDGAAGARELQTGDHDLLLLDIGLSFVDAWEILHGLEGRRVPLVVVISARGSEQDKVRALDMGADDYLAKPFGTSCWLGYGPCSGGPNRWLLDRTSWRGPAL